MDLKIPVLVSEVSVASNDRCCYPYTLAIFQTFVFSNYEDPFPFYCLDRMTGDQFRLFSSVFCERDLLLVLDWGNYQSLLLHYLIIGYFAIILFLDTIDVTFIFYPIEFSLL